MSMKSSCGTATFSLPTTPSIQWMSLRPFSSRNWKDKSRFRYHCNRLPTGGRPRSPNPPSASLGPLPHLSAPSKTPTANPTMMARNWDPLPVSTRDLFQTRLAGLTSSGDMLTTHRNIKMRDQLVPALQPLTVLPARLSCIRVTMRVVGYWPTSAVFSLNNSKMTRISSVEPIFDYSSILTSSKAWSRSRILFFKMTLHCPNKFPVLTLHLLFKMTPVIVSRTPSFPRPCFRCLRTTRSTAVFSRYQPAQQSWLLGLCHKQPSDRWLTPHSEGWLVGRDLMHCRS